MTDHHNLVLVLDKTDFFLKKKIYNTAGLIYETQRLFRRLDIVLTKNPLLAILIS